jgi:ATP-dependent Clp protease ATP-binding subunit ClpB
MAMNSPVVDEINRLADEIKQINTEKSAIENKETMEESDYPRLADLKTKLLQKNQQFDELSKKRDMLELNEYHLAKVIEVWTGIPATNISENSFQKMKRLETKSRRHCRSGGSHKVREGISAAEPNSYKKKPVPYIAGTTAWEKRVVKVAQGIV